MKFKNENSEKRMKETSIQHKIIIIINIIYT